MPDAQSSSHGATSPLGPRPCGSHSDAPWLCVYTKPNAEREALQHLRQQSFPTYLPLHVDPADRQKRITPVFPRYLFAQPFAGSWSAMVNTRGVSAVLRRPNGSAQVVPHSAVDLLLAQCAPNLVIYPAEQPEFHENDPLRITVGPFAELTGIFRRSTKDRVWLLLEILGRPTEIAVARNQLEPA